MKSMVLDRSASGWAATLRRLSLESGDSTRRHRTDTKRLNLVQKSHATRVRAVPLDVTDESGRSGAVQTTVSPNCQTIGILQAASIVVC